MKKNLFVSCAALSLLLSGLVGCNNSASSEPAKSSSAPASSQPSSSSSALPSSSSSSVAPSGGADANQNPVNQQATPDADGNGETITWDAQDSNKDASSGFSSAGKFGANGDYVQYSFTASMAMKARLWVEVADRTDGIYKREDKSGNQSVWYDFYNGPGWKYTVTVNSVEINQDSQAKVKVGEEDIEMKELLYKDFMADGASNAVVPWFEFDCLQGKNTIRIERTLGYSVSVKSFKVVGKKVA